MSLPSIGQAEMLGAEFAKLLKEFSPPSLAVIGCAGGNGFEHIRAEVTSRVVGVDINPQYVQALASRFADRIRGLELCVCDVQGSALTFEPVDLIYAALVFEYVAPAPTLRNLRRVCRPDGILATVLQLPSDAAAAVSPSPYETLKTLAPAIHLLSPVALVAYAFESGFVLHSSHQISLPSGKRFAVQLFRPTEASASGSGAP